MSKVVIRRVASFGYRAPLRNLTRVTSGRYAIARSLIEVLERRTMLSAAVEAAMPPALETPEFAARLTADGFERIEWNGRSTWARPDEWIVKVGNNVSVQTATRQLNAADPSLEVEKVLSTTRQFVLHADTDLSFAEVRDAVDGVTGFTYVEPNFALWADALPNDPSFGQLYGLHNTGQTAGTSDADIDAPEAWEIIKGSPDVVVGVIDTGVDYNHPDLAANMWHNPGETPNNGVDDDANGFVDDYYGYDFVGLGDSNPFDDNRHGTHVSGTIAGVGNNGVGVTGVSWNAKIMALKFLSGSGSGSTDDAIEAVNYATMMRQRGVNLKMTSNSWGGGGFSQALFDAIKLNGDGGMLFVAAAGNNGSNTDVSINYPSGYNLASIISVAATDHADGLASFSNYGATSVDLAAPGVNTYSTTPNNSYESLSGTSMATPHVSGAAALAWSVNPAATWQQVKQALLDGGDSKPSLAGKTVTGKRLNALGTLNLMGLSVASSTPAAGAVVGSSPTEFVVGFSAAIDVATLQATDLEVNGVPADGVVEVTPGTTYRFTYTTTPVTTEGAQTMTIAAGAVTSEVGARPIVAWSSGFRYDPTPLTVTGTSPASGATVPVPMTTLDVDFSEPIDAASVVAGDLLLSTGTVTGVTMVDADTARFSLAGLVSDAVLSATMAAGAVKDGNGNPLASPFTATYALDRTVAALPYEFVPVGPPGAMAYVARSSLTGAATGIIGSATDTDGYTVDLDANQQVSIVVDPATSLRATVTLLNPNGNVVATQVGATVGADVLVQAAPVTVAGTYTIVVSGEDATTGSYELTTFLNAREERESRGGPLNGSVATAESLDPHFQTVVDATRVATVHGRASLSGGTDFDWYGFDLVAGQSVNLTASSGVTLELQSATNLLALGSPVRVGRAVDHFIAPTSGRYFAVVGGVQSEYGLSVVINGSMDRGESGAQQLAQPVTGRTAVLGAIGPQGSVSTDYYRVALNAGDALTLSTLTPGDGPGQFTNALDPALQLLSPGATVVATNDNGAPDGRNALLAYTAPTAGLYIIGVYGVTPAVGYSPYVLNIAGATGALPAFTVTGSTPANGAAVGTVTEVAIDLSDAVLATSLSPLDLTVDGVATTSARIVDADTVAFTVPGNLAVGSHLWAIAAGALSDTQGTPLAAGSGSFTTDPLGPRVLTSSLQQGDVRGGGLPPFTYTVTFNEPLKSTSLDPSDFTLVGALSGAKGITNVTYDAAARALYLVLPALESDAYTLTLLSGDTRIEDVLGNDLDGEPVWPIPAQGSGNGVVGGNFFVNFSVDEQTAALPKFAPVGPLGSLAFDASAKGSIGTPTDTDDFTLKAEAGHGLGIVVTSAGGAFVPKFEVYAPNGALVGSAVAPSAGKTAVLSFVGLSVGGTYTVRVGGAGGTVGAYGLRALLNAAPEAESTGGGANDTPATAQSLDGLFVSPGAGGVARAAVVGTGSAGPANTFYSADFETGADGFVTDNYKGGLWHRSTGRGNDAGHSAVYSFYYGQNEGPAGGGNYSTGAANAGYLTSSSIVLPAAGTPELRFNYKLQTEGSTSWDYSRVQISVDGGTTYTTLASYNGVAEGGWKAAAPIGLGAYAGKTVKLRWLFDTVDSIANTFEGWYLDDVQVLAQAPSPDVYAVTLSTGAHASFAVDATSVVAMELLDANGAVVATGAASGGYDRLIADFVAPAGGTYYVKVVPTINDAYTLVATRNGTLDNDANDTPAAAQTSTAGVAVLGHADAGGSGGSGRMFVYDATARLIRELDPTTGTILRSFATPVPASPSPDFGLATTATTVLAGGAATSAIYELNPDTGAVIRTLPNPGNVEISGLAYLNGEIFVESDQLVGQVKVLDYATGAVKRTLTLTAGSSIGETLGSDGINLYGMSFTSLYSIDPQTGATTALGVLPGVASAEGLGFGGAGEMFVADFNVVRVFDLATRTAKRTLTGLADLEAIGADGNSPVESDWYAFPLVAGDTFTLATLTPGDGTNGFGNLLNPAIELYAPDGLTLLAANDNGGSDGRNAALTFVVPADGTYVVKVKAVWPTRGAYVLNSSVVPAPPAPLGVDLASASDTGASSSDDLTKRNNGAAGNVLVFDVTGTVVGATVTLFVDNAAVGSAVANGAVTTITTIPGTPLGDGSHAFTAAQYFGVGPAVGASPELLVTIDTTAPSQVAADLAAASDTGALSDDDLTADTTPTFVGTTGPSLAVDLLVDGDVVASTVATAGGAISVTPPSLGDGEHFVALVVYDEAGNGSTGPQLRVVIDATPPPAPPAPALDAASDSGVVGDGVTSTVAPGIRLRGTPGDRLRLFVDGAAGASGVAGDAGDVLLTAPTLAEGTHTLLAVQTDAAGNVSAQSASAVVRVDTAAPVGTLPNLGVPYDAPDASINLNNAFTDGLPLTFALNGNTNAALFSAATIDPATNVLRLDYAPVAAGGTATLTVRATDAAGNYVDRSFAVTAAAAPVIAPFDLVMDNTTVGGISRSSGWTASAYGSGILGANYLHDGNLGKGARTVRYTPTLPASGTYDVYAWWVSHSTNRAPQVPYAVAHAGGVTTVNVDQRANGGKWNKLGTFTFNAGTGGSVLISNAGTNGVVVADGVRFVRTGATTPPPPPAPTPLPAPGGFTATAAGSTTVNLAWADVAGETGYALQRSTAADFSTNVVESAPAANATTAAATGLTAATTYYFRVRAQGATGAGAWSVVASAKTAAVVTPPPTSVEVVMDNNSGGVTRSGGWTPSTYGGGFLGTNYLHDAGAKDGLKWARYAPTLPSAGTYQLWGRWTTGSNRASNSAFEVVGGAGGSPMTTVRVDQRGGASGTWVLIGTFDLAASGASVTIRNTGTDGIVVADGLKFVKL